MSININHSLNQSYLAIQAIKRQKSELIQGTMNQYIKNLSDISGFKEQITFQKADDPYAFHANTLLKIIYISRYYLSNFCHPDSRWDLILDRWPNDPNSIYQELSKMSPSEILAWRQIFNSPISHMELIFGILHEIGHIALEHHNSATTPVFIRQNREYAADLFAYKQIPEAVFGGIRFHKRSIIINCLSSGKPVNIYRRDLKSASHLLSHPLPEERLDLAIRFLFLNK